jgi:hypothetical protein
MPVRNRFTKGCNANKKKYLKAAAASRTLKGRRAMGRSKKIRKSALVGLRRHSAIS